MTDKIICYYHDDLDGIMSAIIVAKKFPNAKFIKVNYGDDWHVNDIIDSYCIIVDFSFPNMDELKQCCDSLCWIDHHKSAMERNEELWNSDIYGRRNLDKSGCELTWEHFFIGREMPEHIKLIGDMDMWKFQYGDRTKRFIEGLSIRDFSAICDNILYDMTETRWDETNNYIIEDICEDGVTLLEAKRTRIKKSFADGFEKKFMGHKTFFVNTNHDISNMGEYIYKDKNYPIAFIYSFRNDEVICSLRSNTIDVGDIAKKFDGGGHKFAAGFEMSIIKFCKLITGEILRICDD